MVKLYQITDEKVWLEKRKGYVTSTESATLFGLQMASLPTAFELWHIKRGLIDGDIEANNYMKWGKIFESAILEVIKDDNPEWNVSPMRAFACDDDDKIGSSYDNIVDHPERGVGILEIKMTSYRHYKENFIEDDDGEFIECPPYYEVQGQHELEVLDMYDYICFAVAIVDTREIKYIFRDRNKHMGKSIRSKVEEFWSMESPPDPDLIKDSDLLARMHRANSSDATYDATEDTDFEIAALSYMQESQKEKAAKEAKKESRSQMILLMKEHNAAWCNSARVANKKSFRVTATKGE